VERKKATPGLVVLRRSVGKEGYSSREETGRGQGALNAKTFESSILEKGGKRQACGLGARPRRGRNMGKKVNHRMFVKIKTKWSFHDGKRIARPGHSWLSCSSASTDACDNKDGKGENRIDEGRECRRYAFS